jgi:hypothetical protein
MVQTTCATIASLALLIEAVKAGKGPIISHPLLSHHTILQRRNLHVTNPGITEIHNIPNKRKLDSVIHNPRYLGQDEASDEHESNTLEVNGLFQGYGTHYVDLWVGTPPQRQTVIVDTGSGVTAFPCQDCINCGKDYHASDLFQESQSSTFNKLACGQCQHATCRNPGTEKEFCHLSVSYQEGSMWAAYQGLDVAYIGGLHTGAVKKREEGHALGGQINGEDPLDAAEFEFNMMFGCQTKITKLFLTQLADGIMGMCLKDTSIFSQMHQQNVIEHPSFAMCYVRGDDAAKDGTLAGTLTMGGADTKLHLKEMVYAKGFKTKGVMHGVTIRKVHIMGDSKYEAEEATPDNIVTVDITEQSLNSGSVIVDSGTTDTYLTRNLKGPFMAAFKQLVGYDYKENGMKLSQEQVEALPTILIQLEGIENMSSDGTPGLAGNIDPDHPFDILVAIPPAHYVEYDSDDDVYVGRFSVSEGRGSVIGGNTMRGHDVLFDIPQNGRIGFAVSDCDYRNLFGLEVPLENEVREHNGNHQSEQEEDKDGDGDDYYDETQDSEKLELTQTEKTDDASSKCDDKCRTGVIFVGVAAMVLVLAVAVYRKKSAKANYQRAIVENEHLNDLVLDTEVELGEMS